MIYNIIVILIIVVIKGVFSAADTAFTYINRPEIKQLSKKDKKAMKIKMLMEDANRFFGMIEVGLNVCELICSAYVSITIVEELAFLIQRLPIDYNVSLIISSLIMTLVLSYVLLVFGSILPKKVARNYPKKTAFKLINILWIITKLNYPFEKLITSSEHFFSKIFKLKSEPQEKMTEKQLKMIIKEAKEEGVVANIEKTLLLNAIKADDTTVGRIMIPIEKIDAINVKDNFERVLNNIRKYHFTRIPVYQKNINNIIGILNTKDILIEYAKSKSINKDLQQFLRPVKFIHKEEKIFKAFKKMQKENQVIAVIVDAENIPLGIISIEDILEKLVGKIFDEDDIS